MRHKLGMIVIAVVATNIACVTQVAVAQTTLATDGQSGWISSLDYLHWSVRSADVEYGVTDVGGVQDRGAVGQVLSIGGNYDSGFRFSTGYRMQDGPELLFQYTDFDSSHSDRRIGSLRASFISSDNSENDDSDNINTLGVETVTPDDRATSATASRIFGYQVYDMELAQTLALTENFSLRLSGGGRGASIDQRFDVTYTGGDFQVPYRAFKTGDYQGGGIIAGGDMIWHLLPSVSLNLGTNVGMMLGSVETWVFMPDDEPGVPTDVRFEETRMTPVLEMSAGLNVARQVRGFTVSFAAGYEMTNWFNLSDSRTFTDAHMEAQNAHLIDDISLDGAYLRIALNR